MTDDVNADPARPSATASPTGTPLVPVKAVPYIAAINTAAGGIMAGQLGGFMQVPPAVVSGATIAYFISALLLGMSPGLRK